jgi:hypothetical protein
MHEQGGQDEVRQALTERAGLEVPVDRAQGVGQARRAEVLDRARRSRRWVGEERRPDESQLLEPLRLGLLASRGGRAELFDPLPVGARDAPE